MKRIALLAVLFMPMLLAAPSAEAQVPTSRPKVRAITGFVRLDQGKYVQQVADALAVLRKVKADFVAQGYEVESLRLTTQPLAELVAGLPEDQALKFLAQFDQLSVKEDFTPNVGPAMMHDS